MTGAAATSRTPLEKLTALPQTLSLVGRDWLPLGFPKNLTPLLARRASIHATKLKSWIRACIVPCPTGAQKYKTAVVRVKFHFSGIKSATLFLCVRTVSENIVRHSLAYLSVQKWLVGTSP